MDIVAVAAVILVGIAVTFIYFGVSDYQTLMNLIAYEQQAMKDGTYCYGCPSMATVTMDSVILRFVAGAAFGIASFVLFLMKRSVGKNHEQSRVPDV